MKLYTNPISPNSRKVLAVAKHLGLDVEVEMVDLQKGAHQTAEYLAINPNGMVPSLTDGEVTLWESNAILAYLASKKDTALWPKSNARYDIIRWMSWQLAHFGPATDVYIWENMLKGMLGHGESDPAKVEEGAKKFHRFTAVLNGSLEGKKFLVGDALTLADFAVAAPLTYAAQSQMPLDDYTHVNAWLKRMNEIPAWRDTAPKM